MQDVDKKPTKSYYLAVRGVVEAEPTSTLGELLQRVERERDPENRLRGLAIVVDACPELKGTFIEVTDEKPLGRILHGDFTPPNAVV